MFQIMHAQYKQPNHTTTVAGTRRTVGLKERQPTSSSEQISLTSKFKWKFENWKFCYRPLFTHFFGAIMLLIAIEMANSSGFFDTQGPNFSTEPPHRVEFTSSAGTLVDCTAHGNPAPNVEWLDKDNNPITSVSKVRHILANGSLFFPHFEAEEFRQDVHWSVYKCVASNSVGTIVSRDVIVKAVVNQRYEPEVQNPGGFIGSNVLIKCNIPSFVKEYVKVTSWLQEPNFNIYPSLEGDGKSHMLPTGELLVLNVTRLDALRIYRCRTHHQLTQEAVVSSNVGKIQLTEMRELVPPIINEKLVVLTVRVGDPVVIPCVAYANPTPVYRWHSNRNGKEGPIDSFISTNRAKIRDGTLIISAVEQNDGGLYFCTATNSEGSETLEVQLSTVSPLSTTIQPIIQTVNLGKSADLVCRCTGFPIDTLTWFKDGQPLRSGARVRLLSNEHIRITSITKEDKGMYQCFVKNDKDSSQATAELRLGEVAPQFIYKFIEQTMQPGPSVSLKCSATGNPTPRIIWNLDGFPLPNNDRLMIGQYVTLFGDVISHVNISAVKSEDGGEYECKAISKAGESSHSARLNIYGMPYVRPMAAISAVAGKSFSLKCPVAGYPIESITLERVPPKITPFSFARDLNVGDRTSIQCVIGTGDLPLTFTWLKDGHQIFQDGSTSVHFGDGGYNDGDGVESGGQMSLQNSARNLDDDLLNTKYRAPLNSSGIVTIRQNDDFTSALSITSVTQAQSGAYTCRVQNNAATVSHSAQLRVNVPPRISPFNFEEEITEGMRTQLMCSSSQGDQPFNITWLKDDILIDSSNNIVNGGLGSSRNNLKSTDPSLYINEYAPFSSILSIHNVSSRHNGNYTCRITNRAGSVEYTAVLSVAVPPRWVTKPSDKNAILGTSVVINCIADGFPLPNITWKQSMGEHSGDYRDLGYSGSNSMIMTHNNGSLIIPKVSKEHEGSYLCQASNGIGAGLSTLIKLTVHVGPQITVRNKQVTVRRGDRINLRCEAEGDQPLDIYWRAKGNRIDTAYDIRYNLKDSPINHGVISELSIMQALISDRGEYSCVVSNAYGHDKAIFNLQVQEPPNFPINLHVVELGSRTITLAWSRNEQDQTNSNRESQPISNYILQYKKAQEVWHEHNNQKLLPGDKTSAQVSLLKPSQAYHFRLYAENHLGTSAPSDILLAQTDAEVPSGRPQSVAAEPLGPQQLLITWRPPDRDSWNGELIGYTIGYQKHDDNSYNYTKLGILVGEGLHDFRLTGLKKYTQYDITVSAFNIKGDGPASEPITVHTLEDVPSVAPQSVTCIALTGQNIQISWQAPPKEHIHGIIQGYKLLYEPCSDESDYGNRETKITSSMNTVLHGLQPFTKYCVQVLAFTRAGEGVLSSVVSCTTEEAVPDAPEKVKSVVSSESSVIISWLPPRRPNGIVTKYNVYIRILDKGQELKILKEVLPAHNRHFEAKDLTTRETYESWVTASTRIGQGPSTPVIKLSPSFAIPAAIITFGQTLSVSWKVDMKLTCLFVGNPKPNVEWKLLNARSKKQFRLEVGNDNTLTLRNIQRSHEGNYSCSVRNALGSDHVVYQLIVQVPPAAPILSVTGTTFNSVSLQWRVEDTGGAALRGFTLTYRKEFNEWDELQLDRRIHSHMLENLQCGTRYQFTITTFNKIGSGVASLIESAKTKGNKPVPPSKHNFIRPNITSALLELSCWQDEGCPILYYTIEFRRYGITSDWIIVSSSLAAQPRYILGDLEPAKSYSLRITAHNHAGSTIAEYVFDTLHLTGLPMSEEDDGNTPQVASLFRDVHFIVILIISIFGTVLALLGACICFRHCASRDPRQLLNREINSMRPPLSEGKDPRHQNRLERIPEFSEDIYPYATFHLPDHENQSGNISRIGMVYEPRDQDTLKSANIQRSTTSGANTSGRSTTPIGVDKNSVGTNEKRQKRISNTIKSESEEYDSLNSDSDISADRNGNNGHTESNSHLEEPAMCASHGISPISRSCGNKERLSVFNRTPLHSNNSMDINLDHRLFDPPTKQSSQSTAATSSTSSQQQQQQQRHLLQQHNNTNITGLPYAKVFKDEPSEMCSTRITQSGSYVEILKSTAYQNLNIESQGQKSSTATNVSGSGFGGSFAASVGLKKSSLNGNSTSSSCQNKSYGDFLTITPRRKGKLLSTSAAIGNDHYQHSIQPLHLLGVDSNGTIKSTKNYDYRTMETTISNADTLLLGSAVYPKVNKAYCASISNLSSSINFDCSNRNTSNVIDLHQISTEKNLSPPSAFSDGAEKSSLS